MGARGRARDGLAAGGGGGELPQYLQPGSRRDLRRCHPGRGQAVPSVAQRGQAARLQARVGSVPHRAGHATGHRRCVRGGRGVHSKTVGAALKRLGVIGSMVWDTIHGRDPAQAAVQEWGGISYALAALDATLPDDWEIVPLIKVGRDLAPKANAFLRTLRRTTHDARFLEVPQPNNRVTLRYESVERRCEQMTGGVPPWTWAELGPLVRDLDALYVNFISGFEMNLETAQLLRRGFPRFMYADLHSLFLGKEPDGMRVPRALPQAPAWFGCFNVIQLNEDEMQQLGSDPLAIAADALRQGCSTLCVTLGKRGGPGGGAAGGDDARRTQPDPPRRDGTARPPDGEALDRMTRLVEVPTSFDDRSFDQFAAAYAQATDGERLLFDAHAAEWASPYGLVGLLAAGEAAARKGERPLLTAPANPDVVSYWARAGFFREAGDLFEVHGKVPKAKVATESEVLLPVTPVRAAEDVHAVVSTIQQRASAILSSELGLDPKATMGFAMALSESCQNIVEHAGTGGWVAVQAYNWRRKLARRVVVIAVADAGVGFRHSLEPTQAKRFGERWGDAAALEAALIQGVSRFRDPGRGQGLAGIRRYLARWEGKVAIRSGTARIAIVPRWDDDVPLKDGLPEFPGSQVLLIIPEQESEKGGASKQ